MAGGGPASGSGSGAVSAPTALVDRGRHGRLGEFDHRILDIGRRRRRVQPDRTRDCPAGNSGRPAVGLKEPATVLGTPAVARAGRARVGADVGGAGAGGRVGCGERGRGRDGRSGCAGRDGRVLGGAGPRGRVLGVPVLGHSVGLRPRLCRQSRYMRAHDPHRDDRPIGSLRWRHGEAERPTAKRLGEVQRTAVPLGRELCHGPGQLGHEPWRHIVSRQGRKRIVQHAIAEGIHIHGGTFRIDVRRVSDEECPHCGSEAVDIGESGLGLLKQSFRRGVVRRHHLPGQRAAQLIGCTSDAEIGQRRAEPGAQDVGRLHIAVQDAGLVRRVQRLSDLDADLDDSSTGSGPWRRRIWP